LIARHHRDADFKGLRFAQNALLPKNFNKFIGRPEEAPSFCRSQDKTLCSPEWEGASLTSGLCEKRGAWHALSKS